MKSSDAVVARFIFRFDFDVAFDYMNRQGTAAQILHGSDLDFWQELHSGAGRNQLEVRRLQESYSANLTFEPATVNASLELADPVPPAEVLDHEIFKKWNDAVRSYFDVFKITAMKRVGIRFILCTGLRQSDSGDEVWSDLDDADVEWERDSIRDPLNNIYAKPFLSKLDAVLGNVVTSELTASGEHEDGIRYRLAAGPTRPERLRQLLKANYPIGSIEELVSARKFLLDLDLYEENISFSEHSLYRWSKVKLERVNSICQAFDELEVP